MKIARTIAALVLCAALSFGFATVGASAVPAVEAEGFTDVSSSISAHVAQELADAGLMLGVGGGKFAPDTPVNYAMAITILGRLAGAAQEVTDDSSSWYSGYVNWAKENGILTGWFDPSASVTARKMDAMLEACAKLMGVEYTASSDSDQELTRMDLAGMVYYVYYAKKNADSMGNIGVVETESGLMSGVKGQLYDNVTMFKGVPFAAPPVGDLRWKEPVDADSWEGVRVSDMEGDAPLMPSYVNMLFTDPNTPWIEFYSDGAPTMSEDCLYLNIATPAQSADEKLPVVIWFHGGGFQNGYYYEPEFDPEVLASKGCVVVSVGMRLGIFGFFALPQLSEESDYGASGNYGMMDCIKGTQWVIDNIAAFGGDPENITLMGQSGGSSKVTGVLVSPMMEGKIAGTINQSYLNAFSNYATMDEVEAAGQRYLGILGLDANITPEELRALDADFVNSMSAAGGGGYKIAIDGKYFTESPADFYLREGQLEGINMMCGNVFGEAASGMQIPGIEQPAVPQTADELYVAIRAKYGDELCDKYELEKNFVVSDWTAHTKYIEFATKDALAGNRLFAAVKNQLNETGDSYIYTFGAVEPGPRKDGSEIGWHSGELWYMFGSLHRETVGYRDWEIWDYAAAEVATDYWSNFIKTGNPNGSSVPEWPEASDMSYQYIDWNAYTITAESPLDQMILEYYIAQYGLEAYF